MPNNLPREAERSPQGKSLLLETRQPTPQRRELLPSEALSPLVEILAAEQAVYEDLLKVAAEERAAIVDARLAVLKTAVERKQGVLERLKPTTSVRPRSRKR